MYGDVHRPRSAAASALINIVGRAAENLFAHYYYRNIAVGLYYARKGRRTSSSGAAAEIAEAEAINGNLG